MKFKANHADIKQNIVKLPEQSVVDLRNTSLFFNFSNKEIACFQAAAQPLFYKKGRVLYLQGDLAENFYVVCGGWIKLFHTMPEGEEVIVDMLTAGHIVGESAMFDHGYYTSSAQIVTDVQLLRISIKLLKEQINISHKLVINMLTSMSKHHRSNYGTTAFNVMQNAPQRIGCFLLGLCPDDKKGGIVLHLPYNKTLIAEVLGMKGPTFSRALNILRKKTDIRIRDTRVEIDSIEPLLKFIYGPLATKFAPRSM